MLSFKKIRCFNKIQAGAIHLENCKYKQQVSENEMVAPNTISMWALWSTFLMDIKQNDLV